MSSKFVNSFLSYPAGRQKNKWKKRNLLGGGNKPVLSQRTAEITAETATVENSRPCC